MESATVRAAELTMTEAAVLALLAIEGRHTGYELAKLMERSIGHVWSPARSGLYAVLPRLANDGLLRRRHVSQKTRPDKQVYAISAAGERALQQWLETVEPGATDAFYLKLFVGGLTSSDVLREQLEQFRADAEDRLALYAEIEETNTNRGHDWYHRRLLELAIARARLD